MTGTPTVHEVADIAAFVKRLTANDASFNENVADEQYRRAVVAASRILADRAFSGKDDVALREAHVALAGIYDWCFAPPRIDQVDSMVSFLADDVRDVLERAMLQDLRDRTDDAALSDTPSDHGSFLPWYRSLISAHEASSHVFYRDFLENRATVDDLRFYLAQETSLDPRFDDILALLIMGTDGSEKMELVSNLWDELGNGEFGDVHTSVFAQTLLDAGVRPEYIASNLILESRICGNVSAALALSKRHYYKAIGYFGVTEYLTPRRFRSYVKACRRLGLPEAAYRYHNLHIQIDGRHGPAWFRNILVPAMEREPQAAHDIALGTLFRLETSKWYLDALQAALDPSS